MRRISFLLLTLSFILLAVIYTITTSLGNVNAAASDSKEEEGPQLDQKSKENIVRGLALRDEDISRMNMKELRRQLKRRGVECYDCIEKEHFRERLKEAVKQNVDRILTQDEQEGEGEEKGKQEAVDKKVKTQKGAGAPPFNLDGLKESFMKKKEQNKKMKETLQKAGYDTSSMNFGGDDVLEKLFDGKVDL